MSSGRFLLWKREAKEHDGAFLALRIMGNKGDTEKGHAPLVRAIIPEKRITKHMQRASGRMKKLRETKTDSSWPDRSCPTEK